ncbi:hypothetical protein CHH28_17165 [Bacterioplanes sanyensis]|uniref:Uncharacterized protein n=1 Tax=Bacterioplanes sanyensis TaxID=1249553 RepID=A0A222FND0_9GAMM|nr:hypothetical protein [Bacterioplanes sanyensis]ASP40300.1 hypothetical protein CHH28_17165 [Bacterioplanes sanyensis]
MTDKFLWPWAMVLCWVCGTHAQSGDEQLRHIYKMPVWIAESQRVCPWKTEAAEGYVRLVRTEQSGQHRLFLQWIRKGIAGGPTEPISTVVVKQLEQQYQVRTQLPNAVQPGSCELLALAEDIHNERRYEMRYFLSADKPGHYQLDVTHKLRGGS